MAHDRNTADGAMDYRCAAFNSALAAAVENCVSDPDERRRAIERHGTTCHGCGLTLSEIYGEIAAGFIDVHRVTPRRDPAAPNDFITLCPSCHTVVHSAEPPLPIDELRLLIRKATRARRSLR